MRDMIAARGRKLLKIVVAAGIALMATADDVYGCWEGCTSKYGGLRKIDGSWYELDYCMERWNDTTGRVNVTCYYKKVG